MVKQSDIARALKNLKPEDTAEAVLRRLLVNGLTGRNWEVYEIVTNWDRPVTAREVADLTGLQLNAAINILRRLEKWHLLESTIENDGALSPIEWSVQ